MSNPGPREAAKIVQLAGGEIIGSTRLQKIGCLLEMVGAGVGFDYSYYHFGPYSEELSIAATDADALDLIDIKERTAAWGGRYSIYRSLSDDSVSSDPSVRTLATTAAAANSVALELAVTAAFLAKNGYSNAWEEVAARKSAKATPEMMSQAKSLYKDLRKMNVPVSLPAI
jgi:hypothetical protein